jgi:hypothetical protein
MGFCENCDEPSGSVKAGAAVSYSRRLRTRNRTFGAAASFLLFQAHMKFPPDYPYSPPSIRFLTKVWHPNVYEVSGHSGLSYSRFQWKPKVICLRISKVI